MLRETDVASRRRLGLDDLTRLKHVADAEISPDGRWAAAIVHSFVPERNTVTQQVYVVDVDGGEIRCVSGDDAHDGAVSWAPDSSRLAFVAKGSGVESLTVYDVVSSGRREAVTGQSGLAAPRWSPDGARIAFLAYGPPRRGQPAPEPPHDDPASSVELFTGRRAIRGIVDRATGWNRKVWVTDLTAGRVEQITEGDEDHGNAFFGGDLAWSPDGAGLVYSADRLSGWTESYHRRALYLVDLESGHERRLTPAEGHATRPAFSRDGRHLAYFGFAPADVPALSGLDLAVIDLDSGERHFLTTGLDRPVGAGQGGDADRGPVWVGNGVVATFCDGGAVNIVRFELDGSRTDITRGPQVCQSISGDATGRRLLAVRSDANRLAEACLYEGGSERVVLAPNRELFAEVDVGVQQGFWTSRAGEELQYWILMPPAARERVPVIVDIHGGPSSQFSWTLYYEHQVWSAAGYAVVYGNPRGSHGYSDRFLRGAVGDFGGEDLQDVFEMLDDALGHDPRLDRNRMGVTGYSYGGYMTNRAITVTNRFRAAVSGDGPTDLISAAATSDLGRWLANIYWLGPLRERQDHYIDRSPVFSAHRSRTPLLIYQGADDPRVPASQAEEFIYELVGAGVEAQALLLPGEDHSMVRRIGVGSGSPAHQIAVRRATLEWFDRHVKGGGNG